jgi:hypothetical protein
MTKLEVLQKMFPNDTEAELQQKLTTVTVNYLDVDPSATLPIEWASQFITADSKMVYDNDLRRVYIVTDGEINNPNVQTLTE